MIFLCIGAGVFVLDYFVKRYVDCHYEQGTYQEVLNGKLILRKLHNPHGAFGLFKGREELGEALSAGVLIGISWDLLRLFFSKKRRLEKLGLSMAVGGGLNNLYDRKTKGYVTDYFSFGVKNEKARKMVFNLSDVFIFFGAFFYVLGQIKLLCGKQKNS